MNLEDLFEEVIGEIEEGARGAAQLTSRPDGSVTAAGTVRLDELGQHFDVSLEHEDVDSISGLVLATLARSPVVGDVVDYGRIRVSPPRAAAASRKACPACASHRTKGGATPMLRRNPRT